MTIYIPKEHRLQDTSVKREVWDILQEICHGGYILRNAHEEALKKLRPIAKPTNQRERNQNAERAVADKTSKSPWWDLNRALNNLTSHGKYSARSDKIQVAAEEIQARFEVRDRLDALVTEMFREANRQGLMRKGTLKKGEPAELDYQGPFLRAPLMTAFNALNEWHGYIAKAQYQALHERLDRARPPKILTDTARAVLRLPPPTPGAK